MKKIVVAVFAVWVATLPVAVQAQESEAREAYKKGRELYKAGKYTEAIVELRKAYSLKPHPALLRYMGDTYYKMNDARKAIDHYKKYLKEAPEAADKDKVEAKVRQLELIIGASEEEEEEETTPPPAQAPAVEPTPAPAAPEPKSNIDMMPTGEDKEVPLALSKRRPQPVQPQTGAKDTGGSSALSIMKWVAAGVGVAGLALGITFNRLAAGKAGDLEEAVKTECPSNQPNCGGNPDMNTPKVQFNEQHFNLQQEYKRNQAISIAGFIAGGVGAGAAILMFVLDKPKRTRRATIAPVVAEGYLGLSGEVTF
jgi:tetratricopeptide (TPR) repeat protein